MSKSKSVIVSRLAVASLLLGITPIDFSAAVVGLVSAEYYGPAGEEGLTAFQPFSPMILLIGVMILWPICAGTAIVYGSKALTQIPAGTQGHGLARVRQGLAVLESLTAAIGLGGRAPNPCGTEACDQAQPQRVASG